MNTVERMPGHRPVPRPRPPARRPVQPAKAWDDVDRTLLATVADHALTLEKIAAAAAWSPCLVKDQLIAYAARGLVTKDGQSGRYALTPAGRNRLANLNATPA
ncbi:hypothetical protein [Actinomadura violacea]|uniref:Uncharacterized protein n=1 Tax=Actinomadura violacea TaxID=2819934 RepID=A0ABS3S738_9ACTN|nr:hypothetical protein [Actinomadura violacea]MBO2464020.1 hypothetical protein [Actinomadura violacea]